MFTSVNMFFEAPRFFNIIIILYFFYMSERFNKRDFLKLAGLALTSAGGYLVAKELGLGPKEEPLMTTDWYHADVNGLKSSGSPNKNPKTKGSSGAERETSFRINFEKLTPFEFSNINFADSETPIDMLLSTRGQTQVYVPPFRSYPRTEGLDIERVFEPRNETAIVMNDRDGRIILWAHSGRRSVLDTNGFTMWKLQEFFEEENGSRRHYQEAEKFLGKIVKGSEILIRQGGNFTMARVEAAVRIPPEKVRESTEHVLDMVDWINENFENTGFEKIKDLSKVVMLKFCGRSLAGENPTPNVASYLQSRFVLGVVPA